MRRRQKPVTREWLVQKYSVEKLGTKQIGEIVGRHPKRVWEWLINLGIPTRAKWTGNSRYDKPYHDPEWLRSKYESGDNTYSIAAEIGCSPSSIDRWMRRFGIPRRDSQESIRLSGRQRGLPGASNPMFGRRGVHHPNWKGGCTPDRQRIYSQEDWREVRKLVWDRDEETCQRCHLVRNYENRRSVGYVLHHIASFSTYPERRTDPTNLIVLCRSCHTWVHSRSNINHILLEI